MSCFMTGDVWRAISHFLNSSNARISTLLRVRPMTHRIFRSSFVPVAQDSEVTLLAAYYPQPPSPYCD